MLCFLLLVWVIYMIRKAVLSDLKNIFDVYLKAIDKLRSLGIDQWDEIYPDFETIKNDIERGEMYIMPLNGHIAACGVINKENDGYDEGGKWKFGENYRVIHRLCVNVDFQSMGIGKKMLQCLEDEIKKMKFDSVRIDVLPSNKRAIEMYKNYGYIDVGQVEYRKGIFRLYEKNLK